MNTFDNRTNLIEYSNSIFSSVDRFSKLLPSSSLLLMLTDGNDIYIKGRALEYNSGKLFVLPHIPHSTKTNETNVHLFTSSIIVYIANRKRNLPLVVGQLLP